MRKSVFLTVLALTIGLGTATTYAAISWTGAVDQDWTNGANWAGGAVPGPSDSADIPAGTALGPNVNASVQVGWVYAHGGTTTVGATGGIETVGAGEQDFDLGFNGGAPGATLDNSGTIMVRGRMHVGRAGYGVLNQHAGAITTNMPFRVGREGGTGVANVYGGSITTASDLELGPDGGNGTMNVYGGTVTASGPLRVYNYDYLNLIGGSVTAGGLAIFDGGEIHIEAGKLLLAGDAQIQVYNYVLNSRIFGYGDPWNVMWDITSNPGYTTVWATPEPASLALIGLGLLLVRRRR